MNRTISKSLQNVLNKRLTKKFDSDIINPQARQKYLVSIIYNKSHKQKKGWIV